MGSNYKMRYNVDLVFCIDATNSMEGLIDKVKENALNFYDDLTKKMGLKEKSIQTLRIRIIAFRDYYYDGEDEAMLVTDFFDMASQAEDFRACVSCIEAKGGGDDPEDGLEALAYAMKSDWCREGNKRHVIVVWSDDGTHALGELARDLPYYPSGMPEDFNRLTEWWGNKQSPGIMDENAKRIVIFAPGKKWWTNIKDTWNNSMLYESEAGNGLQEVDYDQILTVISESLKAK